MTTSKSKAREKKMKVHKLKEDWDVTVKPTEAEVIFRKELEDYQNNPYLTGQPIYLVCPQYTYEVEMQPYKVQELLNDSSLIISGIYESGFGISPPREEALPNLEEDYGKLCEALYLLDGVNAYRAEVPVDQIETGVKNGKVTILPNDSYKMMFQKLKRKFQNYCKSNGIPYESWINE